MPWLYKVMKNNTYNNEFEAIEREAGLNSFVLTPKRWVEQTGAKGIVTKQGRYATTFAHQDIAPGGFSMQRKNTYTAKLVENRTFFAVRLACSRK